MSASLTGNFCTPEQVLQDKVNGVVNNCAFVNPALGDGFCGNNTQAMCEIAAGIGSGAEDSSDAYYIFDSNGNRIQHINSYPAMNCLNAGEYGVEDHGAMKYDVNYNRDARFYLTRQTTKCPTGNCNSTADYTVSLTGTTNDGTDIASLHSELVAQKAIELFNDEDGGNFVTYFGSEAGGSGASKSPKIDTSFLHGTGLVTFGTDLPTISMIDNQVQFENMNTCAMQPYGVTATMYEFADPVTASGPGVEGNVAQIVNVEVTDNAGNSTAHPDLVDNVLPTAGTVVNTDGAQGYITFGTNATDVDYSDNSKTAKATDTDLYANIQISKTGNTITSPPAAANQSGVGFSAASANFDVNNTLEEVTGTYASAARTQYEKGNIPFRYDGCLQCSEYYYTDPVAQVTYYPVLHKECSAPSGKTFTDHTVSRKDGTTETVKVCTAGCTNMVDTDASAIVGGSFNASTMIDTAHTQGLCDATNLVETGDYYIPPPTTLFRKAANNGNHATYNTMFEQILPNNFSIFATDDGLSPFHPTQTGNINLTGTPLHSYFLNSSTNSLVNTSAGGLFDPSRKPTNITLRADFKETAQTNYCLPPTI